jgi:hypothetical protein
MSSTTNADASPVAHLNHLKKDAEQAYNMRYEQAKPWKALYYGGRGSLILFSGLTSAQALAAINAPPWAQGIFALLVTLITGFDVWLKPGAKYRALYTANDEYAELKQKLELARPDDLKRLEILQDEYRQINLRLRTAIMP